MNLEPILRWLEIEAQKRGREWTALCPSPSHADTNPSWWIHDEPGKPEHGKHICFSCGFKGDLATLVAVRFGISRAEAEAKLGVRIGKREIRPAEVARFGYVEETRVIKQVAHRESFRLPAEAIRTERWPSAALAFLQSRGVTEKQIRDWDIRFALSGRLAGRIVLPKHRADGVLVGYTARAFTKVEEERKRYLEPMAEEHPDRSIFYGERAWGERQHGGVVVVTEGAFNALVFDRATPHAVAALSGSLTTESVLKLVHFSKVYIATDNDDAGNKVAKELQEMLGRYTQVFRVRWPADVDAVDFARAHGDSAVHRLLKEDVCLAS